MTAPLHTADEFGILFRKKKYAIAMFSVRKKKTKEKNSLSTTAQTYWQSSDEKWEDQQNYNLKCGVHRNVISCLSIRKDWNIAFCSKIFCPTRSSFHKRLIFKNLQFSLFKNTNFRKLGPASDESMYEKACCKNRFRNFT